MAKENEESRPPSYDGLVRYIFDGLINNPWFAILVAAVILVVSVVYLLEKFGVSKRGGVPTKDVSSPSVLVQRVEEVSAGTLDVVQEKSEQTFTKKMKSKSTKIVEAAEHGEMKEGIEKCKKFLSSVQATNFACKIFINSWEEIEGVVNFDKIVENIGKQLELPDLDVEGIKLAAMSGKGKKDYLAFECAMKDEGKVRLHTGGYQVIKQKTEDGEEKIDFQIALNYTDISDITLKKLPEKAAEDLESKWFKSSPAIEHQKPEEGEDWNSYFQYTAHKNILKELHEE